MTSERRQNTVPKRYFASQPLCKSWNIFSVLLSGTGMIDLLFTSSKGAARHKKLSTDIPSILKPPIKSLNVNAIEFINLTNIIRTRYSFITLQMCREKELRFCFTFFSFTSTIGYLNFGFKIKLFTGSSNQIRIFF